MTTQLEVSPIQPSLLIVGDGDGGGDGSQPPVALSQLSDIALVSLGDGDLFVYSQFQRKWINQRLEATVDGGDF